MIVLTISMDVNIQDISNAVMIDSLETILHQEIRKLEIDKSGLLPMKSKFSKRQQALAEKEKMVSQSLPISKDSRSHSPKHNNSCGRLNEIERLANLFTQSPGFFTVNTNNNSIDVKRNQVLLKENKTSQKHNEFNKYKVWIDKDNNSNFKTRLISPDTKVRRNIRFGEYSPLNPANQVNAQPIVGIGEYESKKKKLLELQKKEYIEYLSKAKQEKNISDLPKLASYSCKEAFEAAMENNTSTEQTKLGYKANRNNEDNKINLVPYIDGLESCKLDEERAKETHRLKQELYRLELSKQIEEKKQLEFERKRREQLEDEAIERAARDQEEKIRKEFEKEAEKRTLAELQKQLQQEKLKNEILQKQKDLESKSVTTEITSRQVSRHVPSRHESLEDNDIEEICSPSENTFDNVPLPTTRVRVPRKIHYDEKDDIPNTRDVSCNTETFKNPCLNQKISPSVMRQRTEKAHVTFARDPPPKRNDHNPAAQLPVTKSVIIDSPHTLALAGLNNIDDDLMHTNIEPTEAAYRNQISESLLEYNEELPPTDKQLMSNLSNIRKQLDIDYQKLKKQVRKSQ